MNYIVLIFLLCIQYVIKSHGLYFWRDFSQIIPFDAFVAGEDFNKQKVYIGQAFLFDPPYQGIYPTSILKDQDIYVPRIGVRKANNFVQILCSNDTDNFEWIPTNATHFHLIGTDNQLVRGGIEYNKWLSIGRLRSQDGTVIGKVFSGYREANMWFVHNGMEIKAESYEVLTFNNLASKINVRGNFV